jgi:hypothetical protein
VIPKGIQYMVCCIVSFGDCAVCSSVICVFWWPLWYLQTLLVYHFVFSNTCRIHIPISRIVSLLFHLSPSLLFMLKKIRSISLESLSKITILSIKLVQEPTVLFHYTLTWATDGKVKTLDKVLIDDVRPCSISNHILHTLRYHLCPPMLFRGIRFALCSVL